MTDGLECYVNFDPDGTYALCCEIYEEFIDPEPNETDMYKFDLDLVLPSPTNSTKSPIVNTRPIYLSIQNCKFTGCLYCNENTVKWSESTPTNEDEQLGNFHSEFTS